MTLFFWWFLIADIAWREVSKRNDIQAKLHKLGPLALLFQWYTLFFIGYGIILAWSVHEMITHYLNVPAEQIEANIKVVWHEEFVLKNNTDFLTFEDFSKQLNIRSYLRGLSWVAVFCSLGVYCVTFGHIAKYAYACSQNEKHEDELKQQQFTKGVWKPPIRMNMVMLILVNPGVFSVMSLRALCRVWALMTGQTHHHESLHWPQVETIEYALFTGDMELAQAFQYFAVHVFARLCGEYLCDSGILRAYHLLVPGNREHDFHQHALEYRRMITWAAFLVTHAFVAVGIVRCFFDFIIAEARTYESYSVAAETLQSEISSKLGLVFGVLTILCVVNMKIICGMKDITDKLAKAGVMFMGTRILLLISDNQAMLVEAFTVNSTLYSKAMEAKSTLWFRNDLPEWNFYEHQAHMFHLALLNLECLVVVVFNVIVWRSLDVERSELMSPKPLQDMELTIPTETQALLDAQGIESQAE